MNISNPARVWIPACATDIRKTWAQVGQPEDWQARLAGAREVMRRVEACGRADGQSPAQGEGW